MVPEFKQITSSRVHPGSKMENGLWHFLRAKGSPARLLHKFEGVLYEWSVDRLVKKQKWWTEVHISANSTSPGASGATLTVVNTAAITWLLNATNEYLYFGADIHDQWDGLSDILVHVEVMLTSAQPANDTIDAELIAEYFGDHEDMDTSIKTQTRTVSHDIVSDNAQGTVHELIFVIDYDLVNHVVNAHDHFKFRFRLSSVSGTSVSSVNYLCAHMKYQSRFDWPAEKVLGAFPVEG